MIRIIEGVDSRAEKVQADVSEIKVISVIIMIIIDFIVF
jgi:hypothetical protein